MNEAKDDEPKDFKYSPTDYPEDVKSQDVSTDPTSMDDDKDEKQLITWSSPDSFSSKKRATWYLTLLAITLVIAAGIYLLTKDKITTIVILVSGLLIGFYGAKKPRLVNYEINKSSLSVNGRNYLLSNYRSFAVIGHGDGRSIILTPLRRFMPYMYIYCDKNVEPKISLLLSEIMPSEMVHKDSIDKFLRKVGF